MVRRLKSKKTIKRRYFGELLTEREIKAHALKSQFSTQNIDEIYQKELAGHIVNSFLKWSPKLGIKNEMIERLNITQERDGAPLAHFNTQDKTWHFSSQMAYLPIDLVDYLVLRELCHYHVSSEEESYHILISGYMPDYKEREKRLTEILNMGEDYLTV